MEVPPQTRADILLPAAVIARAVRFVVLSSSRTEEERTLAVGVKLELYGCQLSADVSTTDVCVSAKAFTDSVQVAMRQFAAASEDDAVYACVQLGHSQSQSCYASQNGTEWTGMPWARGILDVSSADGGRLYVRDFSNRATMYSTDHGLTWVATPDTGNTDNDGTGLATPDTTINMEANNVLSIPFWPADEQQFKDLVIGNWSATFDGIRYLQKGKVVFQWNRCCG